MRRCAILEENTRIRLKQNSKPKISFHFHLLFVPSGCKLHTYWLNFPSNFIFINWKKNWFAVTNLNCLSYHPHRLSKHQLFISTFYQLDFWKKIYYYSYWKYNFPLMRICFVQEIKLRELNAKFPANIDRIVHVNSVRCFFVVILSCQNEPNKFNAYIVKSWFLYNIGIDIMIRIMYN